MPAIHQSNQINGTVETDEMYFLESFKGQHHLPRAARKLGGKAAKRGTSKEQMPVLVIRDRYPIFNILPLIFTIFLLEPILTI